MTKNQLPTAAERNAARIADLESFGGFSLHQTRRDLIHLLEGIHSHGLFAEYTKHDIGHVDAMLNQLDWIIPGPTQQAMTPADWLLAVLGIYFHDLGMLVTKQEYSSRHTSGFGDFKATILAAQDDRGKDYTARIARLKSDEAERFLYQEFVRANHAKRIRSWIQGVSDPTIGVSGSMLNELQRMLAPLDEVFRDDVAIVCESHHLDDLYDTSKYPISRPYGPTTKEAANVQYAAILLRTVDLLHITRDRTPSVSFRLIDPQDPISQVEWAKQRAVRTIRPKLGIDSEGNLSEEAPKDTIEVHARFTHGDGFFGLTSYLAYAEKQLKKSHEWCARSNRSHGSRQKFPWAKIDTANIETKGFLPRPFEFTFDQNKVLELLTGHTLYNDSSVVVRELVQNALDAVRLQHGSHASHLGEVKVLWSSKDRTLEVRDNGTGMTQEIIEQNLLKVGSSRYQDPAFQKRHPDFSPISRFGIGVLSTFMIADHVEVVTCHPDEEEGRQLILRSAQGKYLVRVVNKLEDPDAVSLGNNGSLVRLVLRPSAKLPDIVDLVRKWIVLPGCSVTVTADDADPVRVGHESVRDALAAEVVAAGLTVSNESEGERGDIRVVERSIEGLSLAYALRWNNYFKEWAFVRGLYKNADREPQVMGGTCIEGIRVESTSPGFRHDGPWAIANIYGPGAPKTNVARSAIEATDEYITILRALYSLYCEHISEEISAMQQTRGHSLTWATHEAVFILGPLLTERPSSKKELDDAIRELPLFLVEDGDTRHSESANKMMTRDSFWTIESVFSFHVEQLLREMPGNTSLRTFLANTNASGFPEPNGPLMCSILSKLGRVATFFLEDWHITEIAADEANRRCYAKWAKPTEHPLWTPPSLDRTRFPDLYRSVQAVADEYTRSARSSYYRVPLGEVVASGFNSNEVAVHIGDTYYLLPNHPWHDLTLNSSGAVDEHQAMILSVLLTMSQLRARPYYAGRVKFRMSETGEFDADFAMHLKHIGMGPAFDVDRFIQISKVTPWHVFNVNQWQRPGD